MDRDGTVERDTGRSTMRFERHLNHSIAEVWAALHETAHLKQWLSDGEPVAGGKVSLDVVTSTVTEAAPPCLLVYDWTVPDYPEAPQGTVRFELTEARNETRQVLTHTIPDDDAQSLTESLGAWHVMLDRLEALLDGNPRPWDDAAWQRHRDRYAAGARESAA